MGNNSDIYIRNFSPLLNKEIKEILPWGIIIGNEQTVSYKVISKIKTNKRALFKEISAYVEKITCDSAGEDLIINFDHAEVKYKAELRNDKILRKFGFFISGLTNRAETMETGFLLYPAFLPEHFFVKMSASVNLFSKYKDYQVSGVFIGGGYEAEINNFSLSADINYGLKSIQYPDNWMLTKYDDGKTKLETVNFEIFAKYRFVSYFSVISGVRYSLDNVRIEGDVDYFTGFCGLSFTF